MSLENPTDEEMSLIFPSGQQFEIVVTDQQGNDVYRYSIDKLFIMALTQVTIPAGEKLEWTEEWDLTLSGERI